MKKSTLTVLVLLGTSLITALVFGAYLLSTYNGAKSQSLLYAAKESANRAAFDNMWKKIQGAAQVTEAQKDALKEILLGYAQARSSGNGATDQALARWVHESVPHVDTTTFNNLQNIIAASRDAWTFSQLELIDIARDYNRRLEVQPSALVLGLFGFQRITPKVITSTRTESTFATARDDDVAAFGRK